MTMLLQTVKRNQQQYDLPLKIVSYEELYGWTMDAIVKQIGLKNNCMLKISQKYYVHNRSPQYLFVADLPRKLCTGSRSAKNNFIQVYSV